MKLIEKFSRFALGLIVLFLLLAMVNKWFELGFGGYQRQFSTEILSFRLDGTRFNVPKNLSDGILQYIDEDTDEIFRAFSLQVRYPEFEGRTKANNVDFVQGGTPDSPIINILVTQTSYYGELRPGGTRPTPQSTIATSLKVRSSPKVPTSEATRRELDVIPGMDFKAVQGLNGKEQKVIYETSDENEDIVFMVCRRLGSVPNPRCQLFFLWANKFLVSASFVRNRRNDWQDIMQKTRHLLDSVAIHRR